MRQNFYIREIGMYWRYNVLWHVRACLYVCLVLRAVCQTRILCFSSLTVSLVSCCVRDLAEWSHSTLTHGLLICVVCCNSVLINTRDLAHTNSLLLRLVGTTLAQLCSGHCGLLNTNEACITSSISNVCLECGVALQLPNLSDSVHNARDQLTTDNWPMGQSATVADFLNLDNWWKEKSCWAITTTITTTIRLYTKIWTRV